MDNKGFTLIEVIVSIFIIGLIGVVFLPSISSSFSFMGKSKTMTVDIFNVQKLMEQEMEEMRDSIDDYIEDGSKPDYRNKTAYVFGKNIPYIAIPYTDEIENNFSYGELYSIIANGHAIEANLPKVSEISLTKSANKPLYGADNSLHLKGNVIINSMANYLTDLKKWYVSKEGFDGYIPSNIPNELDLGTRYPSWPRDYEVIANNETNILNDIYKYLGRHVIFSSTPVSKLGQYGVEISSNSLYVMGPPILNTMTLHLDTYVLGTADNIPFNSWEDISGNSNNASGTSSNSIELKFENGKFAEFRNDTFTIASTRNPTPSNNTMTLFLVFSNTSSNNITQDVIKRVNTDRGWHLYMNNGILEFLINPISGANNIFSITEVGTDKYILAIKVTSNLVDIFLDKNDTPVRFNFTRTNTSNFSGNSVNANRIATTIGGSNSELNISEIIIYSSALSDDDINRTRQFLAKKHRIELAND